METTQEANKKLLDLVKPEYMKRIPFFVHKHATEKTCEKIAREHPDLYAVAAQDGALPEDVKAELTAIINGIFEQKMAKHNF